MQNIWSCKLSFPILKIFLENWTKRLNVQKHTTDKTGFGYNKQTSFSKKTKFASSKQGEPKQGLQKEEHSLF